MNLQAIPALFAFIAAVFLGAFVFFRNTKSLVNKLYLVLVIFCGAYAFVEFGYCQSRDFAQAEFWWKIDVFWPFVILSLFYFMLAFSDKTDFLRRKIVHIVLIPPALTFSIIEIATDLMTGPPVEHSWGWRANRQNTVATDLGFLWLLIMWSANIFIAFRNYYTTAVSHRKSQARIAIFVVLSAFLIFPVEIIRYTIAPTFDFPTPFGLALIGALSFIAYAIWKYEMFALTPITAAEHIIATMSDALLLVDPNGRIISANDSAHEMLGYSKNEIKQLPLAAVLGMDEEQALLKIHFGQDDDLETKRNRIKYLEIRFRTKYGKAIPVSLARSALFDNAQSPMGFVLIGRDISEKKKDEEELRQHREHLEELVEQRTRELKQETSEKLQIKDTVHRQRQALDASQEQLRLLGERLTEVKEEESARIARELHDELGQLLTSLKIDASLLERQFDQGTNVTRESTERARTIAKVATKSISTVQRITKELRPSMLDGIGLVPTIEWMVSEFAKRTGIEVTFKGNIQNADINRSLATAVYRIIQESLTNVARHANATKVSISLSEQEAAIHAVIEDNGIGITEHQLAHCESIGLLGMSERARPLGGTVTISGEPGRGTTVTLSVPITKLAR
ncbi:MAG: PAS domain S-box protein [Myxococcota bacterium]|nr:PAS domain S-box protein [Myxococcota bacterium]